MVSIMYQYFMSLFMVEYQFYGYAILFLFIQLKVTWEFPSFLVIMNDVAMYKFFV